MSDTPAPTLEAVAAAAGVSRSTVSRVVTGSPHVSAAVVASVNDAIDRLGYVPNRAARSLASRRTHVIALVIPENTARFFSDPYFASVIQGVARRLSTTDYTLTLLLAADTEAQKTRRYLQTGNIDGALILSHHSEDTAHLDLTGRLPVVFGGRPMTGGDSVHVVDIDNIGAGHTATQHLIDRGRRRIATISGPLDMSAGVDRLDGWRQALTEAGLAADLHEEGDFTSSGGEAAARRLLDRGIRFDGLYAASAQMASGALTALRDAGLTVPHDVGVVCVDDDYFARSATPPLTTVDQPSTLQGETMADTLVRLIEGADAETSTIIPITLVDRGSA